MKKLAVSLAITLGLAGCASAPEDIQPIYVSPSEYAGYSCDSMQTEMRDISRRVGQLTGQLDEEATADAWQMGVGMVLFWPALLFLEGGDGAQAHEYATLRGKYDALTEAHNRKGCEQVIKPTETKNTEI